MSLLNKNNFESFYKLKKKEIVSEFIKTKFKIMHVSFQKYVKK